MNDKAIRSFVVGLFVLMPCCADAVLGDLNRDGVVDFDDFFILADNFGKRGSPEQIDTVFVRPPPPEFPLTPVADIGLEIVEGSLYFHEKNAYVLGEMLHTKGAP